VIIVAHRLTTLKNCTQIVELEDRKIVQIGSYLDIVEAINYQVDIESKKSTILI
jgi:ATP-binding cassette subfamily B protein